MPVNNETGLLGKTVIITGAGSGIGRAMALRFAAVGARILASDLNLAGAEETVKFIETTGGVAKACATDVSDETSVGAMVEAVASAWGRIDVLCNNAGIMDQMKKAGDVSTVLWERVLRVNLTGVMFGTRAVLPYMLEVGQGCIINTASQAGMRGGAAGAAYTAAKHGVIGLTRNVAWTYTRQGVRCNAICPGGVLTNIAGEEGIAGFDEKGLAAAKPVLELQNGYAEPDQMATVAVFLASNAASFVSGAILPVDHGWSAG